VSKLQFGPARTGMRTRSSDWQRACGWPRERRCYSPCCSCSKVPSHPHPGCSCHCGLLMSLQTAHVTAAYSYRMSMMSAALHPASMIHSIQYSWRFLRHHFQMVLIVLTALVQLVEGYGTNFSLLCCPLSRVHCPVHLQAATLDSSHLDPAFTALLLKYCTSLLSPQGTQAQTQAQGRAPGAPGGPEGRGCWRSSGP